MVVVSFFLFQLVNQCVFLEVGILQLLGQFVDDVVILLFNLRLHLDEAIAALSHESAFLSLHLLHSLLMNTGHDLFFMLELGLELFLDFLHLLHELV